MPDIVSTIARAAGLSWASGLRLYAVLFAVGALSKFGFLTLPEHLQLLSHNGVLIASGVADCYPLHFGCRRSRRYGATDSTGHHRRA
ncbi:MAG: DUF4126 domain-containing protein [Burkholderiales bacterium]